MNNESSNKFAGIYNDLEELVGDENVYQIYKKLRGQQVSFPQRLYSAEYVAKQVVEEFNGENLCELARKYEYTERHLRKLMSQAIEEEIQGK